MLGWLFIILMVLGCMHPLFHLESKIIKRSLEQMKRDEEEGL